MPISINDSGTWKNATPFVNDGGTWKPVQIGYVNDAGTWKIFYSAMTASKSGDASGGRLGAGSVTTNSVTVSPVGGIFPFSYAWTYQSGDVFTLSNPGPSTSAHTTTFTTTVALFQTKSAVYRCTITDSVGSTAFIDVTVTASENS
jgi:hypothetical protein